MKILKANCSLIIIGSLALACPGPRSTDITQENWRTHPKIEPLLQLTNGIDSCRIGYECQIQKKQLVHPCPPELPEEYSLLLRADDSVARFIHQRGSADSALTYRYYYDSEQRLRHVVMEGGAINGASIELNSFFNPDGSRLWEGYEITEPGYTFPRTISDDLLITDPSKAFANPDGC